MSNSYTFKSNFILGYTKQKQKGNMNTGKQRGEILMNKEDIGLKIQRPLKRVSQAKIGGVACW